MNRIIGPFGMFGPRYRTDAIGLCCNRAAYLPALAIIGFTAAGKPPSTTAAGMATILFVSLLFIAPLLATAIARSERLRP